MEFLRSLLRRVATLRDVGCFLRLLANLFLMFFVCLFVCLFTLTYFWLFHVLSQQRHLQIHSIGLVWFLSLTANQRDEIFKIV